MNAIQTSHVRRAPANLFSTRRGHGWNGGIAGRFCLRAGLAEELAQWREELRPALDELESNLCCNDTSLRLVGRVNNRLGRMCEEIEHQRCRAADGD